MQSKFFQRIFSAVQNEEDELLKQVQRDLKQAYDTKSTINTEQIDYIPDLEGGVVNVVDKVNDEITSVRPTYKGYEIEGRNLNYLIPTLTESIEKLTNKLEEVSQEATPEDDSLSEDEGTPEEETKAASLAQDDTKVIITTADGELLIGYCVDEPSGNLIKVKVPSLQNAVLTLPKDKVHVFGSEIPEPVDIEKRPTSEFKTFSMHPKTRTFSPKLNKEDKFGLVQLRKGNPVKVLEEFDTFNDALEFLKHNNKFKRQLDKGDIDIVPLSKVSKN